MDVVMPKWGVTMQEGTITEWMVAEGDTVEEDQPLAHVETDKVDEDVEAPVAGVLTKRCFGVGAVVAVGEVIAIIEES
jgi:pyruvate/2-oxoglutarate dehydrogenase complex dihydrolipoamide acyltransferase (E2) component